MRAEKELAEQEKVMALAWKKQAEEERDSALVAKKLAEGEHDQAQMEKQRALSECRQLTLEKHVAEGRRCEALMKKVETDSDFDMMMNEKRHLEEERDQARASEEVAREQRQSALRELQRMIHENGQIAQEKQQVEKELSQALQEVAALKEEKERAALETQQMEEVRNTAVSLQVEAGHRVSELQGMLNKVEEDKQKQLVIHQQALSADLRGPSWEVGQGELDITEESLGTGGWAEVKVARLKVAAKCLHHQLVYDYHVDAFKREMEVAARVSHPNLLRFLGARLEGGMAILTEFMPTSLRAEIDRCRHNEQGSLPIDQTLSIGIDISCALNYLHNFVPEPIIHRDLSSANVLLQPTTKGGWLAKVSDFGTANFHSQLRTQNPGSPVYTAPEASDPAHQTTKMDVYSFGVLLLEMCTCQFPSPGLRPKLMESIRDTQFDATVRDCLSESPDKRPTAAHLITLLKSLQTDV